MLCIIDDFSHKCDKYISLNDAIDELASIYKHKRYSKDNTNLTRCIGCFGCWVKTPGKCVHSDDSYTINKSIIDCDTLILITNVTYGGYSSFTKSILDRSIPNLSPYFKKVNNEVHHKARYRQYPKLIVIGYGENISEKEEVTFHKLVKANAINFHSKQPKSYIVHSPSDVNQLFKEFDGQL